MKTDSSDAPDPRSEDQRPRERGGLAGDDRSKSLDSESANGIFGSPKEGNAKSGNEGTGEKEP
jgi:hypothetical protein